MNDARALPDGPLDDATAAALAALEDRIRGRLADAATAAAARETPRARGLVCAAYLAGLADAARTLGVLPAAARLSRGGGRG